MKLSLAQLAESCAGRMVGEQSLSLDGVKNLREADVHSLSMYTDRRYLEQLSHSKAGAVLTTERLADDFQGNKILVDNPLVALSHILHAYSSQQTPEVARIASSAMISADATLGDNIHIGALAVIGRGVKLAGGVSIGPGSVIENDVSIDANTRIDANVTIYHGCVLGKRCHISAGAVIGADGFGFAEQQDKRGAQWLAIPQIGTVILGDDVHVGANTAIDRGSLDDTRIDDDVIIDNLVQIAHNVKIGRHTAIAGCAAIAGSTQVGQNCKIGGRASIVGHIRLGDGVVIFADSLVTKSIESAGIYSSAMPVMPLKKWQKQLARFRLYKRN